MRVVLFNILLLQFVFSQTFSDITFVGARSIGVAGSTYSNPTASESAFYNPAGLSKLKHFSVFCGTSMLYKASFLEHTYLSVGIPILLNKKNHSFVYS